MKNYINIETVLASLVVASVIYVFVSFLVNGFLPQPYIYDTNDTFMDWFNTAYWAYHDGAYNIWHSVYPPFAFLFIRIFSLGEAYQYSSFVARERDWLSIFSIFLFYISTAVIAFRSFKLSNSSTVFSRITAFMLGFPMLFALERGNLIIPCLIFFMLGFGCAVYSARGRWIGAALALNLKPYLICAILPLLMRRKYHWVEGCGIAAVIVYIITFIIEDGGSPFDMLQGAVNFSALMKSSYYMDLYNSTSFNPILDTVLNGPFPLVQNVGSRPIELMCFIFKCAISVGNILVLFSFIFIAVKPEISTNQRAAALGLATILSASNPGGYAEVFLIFLVFLESRKSASQVTALVCAYLLCLSFDKVIYVVNSGPAESWLGGREVTRHFGIAVGQFVRPALILGIQYALALGVISKFLKIAYSDRWRPSQRLGSC